MCVCVCVCVCVCAHENTIATHPTPLPNLKKRNHGKDGEKADASPNSPLTNKLVMRQDLRPTISDQLPQKYPPNIIPRNIIASSAPSSPCEGVRGLGCESVECDKREQKTN